VITNQKLGQSDLVYWVTVGYVLAADRHSPWAACSSRTWRKIGTR